MRARHLVNRLLPAVAVAAAVAAAAGHALPAAAAPLPPGQVLRLDGTDHLWVADGQGVVHLAAGPAALAGKPVDWSGVRVASVDGLAALPTGAPYLTADLVQIGDAVYVPQFAADGTAPTLLRVPSPAYRSLLGVAAGPTGPVVLDAATWQQRYGLDPTTLAADEFRLFPAAEFPAPDPAADSAGATETAPVA